MYRPELPAIRLLNFLTPLLFILEALIYNAASDTTIPGIPEIEESPE